MKLNKHYTTTITFILLLLPLLSYTNNITVEEIESASSKQDKAALLYQKGVQHFKNDEMEEAIKWLTESLLISENQSFRELEFNTKIWLGKANYWQSNYQEATSLLNEALSNYPTIITRKDSSYINFQLGYVHLYSGNLDLSLEKRLESFRLNTESDDSIFIADGLYAIAEVLYEKNEYVEALEKATKALAINNNLNRFEQSGFCYDLMANIFHQTSQFKKSLQYREIACDSKHTINTAYNNSYCDQSKAQTYIKLGEFKKARDLFEKAMEIQLKADLKEEYIVSKLGIGETKVAQGNCKMALPILEECLFEAKEIGALPLLLQVYQNLFDSYSHCGKFEKAFIFQNKYHALQDSIISEKMAMNIANLSTRHELEKKNRELAIIQKDNKLKLLYNTLLTALILFMLLLGVLIFYLLKKQYNHNNVLTKKNEEINVHYEELKQSNQKLYAANEDLEQFAYITSHDLKAPLRTIGGYASLIKRRYSHLFDKNGLEYLQFIAGDVEHMHQLLDDILTYSRITKNELDLHQIDLNEIVSSVTRLLWPSIEEKEGIIECKKMPMVLGNYTQLFQLFQNLIENALKFMPPGQQPIISISAKDRNGYQEIAVKDNGIGIDKSFKEKVFTIFKRLHNKNEYEGTGIGLSICKKIVERHGGKIWIESDGKTGTTFLFTLKEAEIAVQKESVLV